MVYLVGIEGEEVREKMNKKLQKKKGKEKDKEKGGGHKRKRKEVVRNDLKPIYGAPMFVCSANH